ncbi:MAG TPA: Gfo/Idh/MocA family oxidoreductase [Armatimonadota bacterium]
MGKVRFGIVGLGIGRVQGNAVKRNPRGEVVAICDLIEWKMEEYAKELGKDVKRYVRFQEMLADPEVDAVFVATGNQMHVPVALEVVKAGKHVLCTKPLSDDARAAAELVKAAEASSVVNQMSLSLRFSGTVQYLGAMSRSGEFGKLYYARARSVRRSGIPNWADHFVMEGGGAFRDMGVHVLDSSWWLLGNQEPVSALGAAGAHFGPRGLGYWDFAPGTEELAKAFKADDFGAGLIRFADGSAIQVESHWASHQPEELNIELFGTEAGARLNPTTVYRTVNGAPADTTLKPNDIDGFYGVADHFIACILDGVPCQAPLRHGLTVQRMMEAVLESGRTGGEVRLDKA